MTENPRLKIGAILLAAGGSSRLGRPKQLLEFEGTTLVKLAAEMLTASACSPVVAVLGAEIERSSEQLAGIDISICINENWNQGMSTSISSGLNTLLKVDSELDAVIIALCDQPLIISKDIDQLIHEFISSGKPIVGSRYDDVTGVPALFARAMFEQLLTLNGDQGARKLIREHPELTSAVEMRSAAIDIDTPDDLVTIGR